MIKTLFLRWLSSNLDNIIAFLQDLDKNIDTLVDAETAKQADIISEQTRLQRELDESTGRTTTALNLKGGLRGLTASAGGVPHDNTVTINA